MALSNTALKDLILAELEAQGINTSGEHAQSFCNSNCRG